MVTQITEFRGKYLPLSNFSPSKTLPPTLEHHYQAAKAEFWKQQILGKESPGEAKRMGRGFPSRAWDKVKDQVMLVLVRKKFQDPKLKRLLLETGDAELIEGNDWGDDYWGRCLSRRLLNSC